MENTVPPSPLCTAIYHYWSLPLKVKHDKDVWAKTCTFLNQKMKPFHILCLNILFLLLPAASTWDQHEADSKRLCYPWLSTTKVCFLPLVQLVVIQTFHILFLSHQHKQWSLVLSVTHKAKYKTGTLNLNFDWRITCAISLCTSKLARPFYLFIYCFLFPLSSTSFHLFNLKALMVGGKGIEHWH